MTIERKDRRCRNCAAYAPLAGECRLNPTARDKLPREWCMQWVGFDVQEHPGSDDYWKPVSRVMEDDFADEANPLGRDTITETTTTTTTTT